MTAASMRRVSCSNSTMAGLRCASETPSRSSILSVSHVVDQAYKILCKELKKVLEVMPIEAKQNRASSSALAHLDGLLDEALEQTFPASDAVAIDIERESHDREAPVLDSRSLASHRKVGQRTAQRH
jgi:hypothetical protein